MPDPSGISPPYLDPSQYPDYLDMQRKQMLASMLMQNSQQAFQTPQGWDSMRVVPRRGAVSYISGLIGSFLAGKAMKGAQDAQSKYFQGLYGVGQSAQPSGVTPSPPAPGAPPDASGTNPAPPVGSASQPQQNPMIPAGMGRGQAQTLMGLMGPEKYAETIIAPRFKPADIRAQIAATGMDPDSKEGQTIALRALNKSLYTAPIQEREGQVLRDPYTGQIIGQNPKTPVGGINFFDNQGNVTGQGSVPGASSAIASAEGATTAAKNANTVGTYPTAGGGWGVGYPQDVPGVGLPPALRDPEVQGTSPPPTAPPQEHSAGASQARRHYFPPISGTAVHRASDGTQSIGPYDASSQSKPGSQPTGTPWDSMPKLPVSGALGAPDDFTRGRLQEAGKTDAELSRQYGKESDLADQKLQLNSQALQALPSAAVGPMSDWITNHRSSLVEAGVPASLIPYSGTVTPTLELNKYLKNSALQGARQVYGPRMTQTEVQLQTNEMSPSTHMTAAAIKSLVEQDNIRNAYAKQRASDYGQFIDQKGDPLKFEAWYSKNFPLQKFAQGYSAPQQSAQAFPQLPPAAQFAGKRLRDTSTGSVLRSNGSQWVPE